MTDTVATYWHRATLAPDSDYWSNRPRYADQALALPWNDRQKIWAPIFLGTVPACAQHEPEIPPQITESGENGWSSAGALPVSATDCGET